VQLVDSWPVIGRISSKCNVKMLQKQGKKKKISTGGYRMTMKVP
jgi:hypothetical protein